MSGISSSSQSLSRKNSSEEPQTDWVCTNCNNLNFSFRQKCNRCKVQSREDNDRILQGGYRYYEPYCLYSDQFAMLEMNAAIRSEQMCTPRKDKEKNYST